MTQCVLLLVFSAAENWQPVTAKLCPYPIYDRLELIWVLTCMGNILDPAKEMQPVEVYGRFMPHEFLSSYSNDQPLAGSWYPSPSTEELRWHQKDGYNWLMSRAAGQMGLDSQRIPEENTKRLQENCSFKRVSWVSQPRLKLPKLKSQPLLSLVWPRAPAGCSGASSAHTGRAMAESRL